MWRRGRATDASRSRLVYAIWWRPRSPKRTSASRRRWPSPLSCSRRRSHCRVTRRTGRVTKTAVARHRRCIRRPLALTAKPAAWLIQRSSARSTPPTSLHALAAWQAALAAVVDRVPIENGVRLQFGAHTAIGELAELAAAEQDCCMFFRFNLTIDTRGIGLEVTAPPDAIDLVIRCSAPPHDRRVSPQGRVRPPRRQHRRLPGLLRWTDPRRSRRDQRRGARQYDVHRVGWSGRCRAGGQRMADHPPSTRTPMCRAGVRTGGAPRPRRTTLGGMDTDDEDVRVAVDRAFATSGVAPSVDELASALDRDPEDVADRLRRLADARHVVLDGDRIVMAHPFSSVPLGFAVMGTSTLWWGGCAWDSFAIPFLVDTEPDVLVATRCPGCERAPTPGLSLATSRRPAIRSRTSSCRSPTCGTTSSSRAAISGSSAPGHASTPGSNGRRGFGATSWTSPPSGGWPRVGTPGGSIMDTNVESRPRRPRTSNRLASRVRSGPATTQDDARQLFVWSGRRDLNPRPLRPERSALPNCATPRGAVDCTRPLTVLRSANRRHGRRAGELESTGAAVRRRRRGRPRCTCRRRAARWRPCGGGTRRSA